MKKLLFLITFLLISTTTFANNRSKNSFFIGVSQGFHLPTLLTTPVHIGYWISKDIYLGIETGENVFSTEKDKIETLEGNYTNKGIIFRYFASKTGFNFYSSYHKRELKLSTKIKIFNDSLFKGEEYTYSDLNIKSDVITIGLSDMWIFNNNITLGIDYGYMSFLIKETVKSNINLGTEESNLKYIEDINKAEIRLEKFGKNINGISYYPGVLIFTLGYSF